MKIHKSWEVAAIAAGTSVWLGVAAACGGNTDSGTSGEQNTSPATSSSAATDGNATMQTPTASGMSANAGGAGATTASGTDATSGAETAGTSGGTAGMQAAAAMPVAVAKLEPFAGGMTMTMAMAMDMTTGASGSSGASGTAGAGAASSSAGSGSSPSTGLSGTATFTKTRAGVDLVIEVTGCEDGKSYPVHIHEGMSCDSAMTQGGHWGASSAPAASAATGAAGSSAAAGASGAAAGAAGTMATMAAAGAAADKPKLSVRGEGIPDIVCAGTMGMTTTSRSTPDVRLVWTLGSMSDTDIVGHVMVVHDDSGTRIACGKIELQQ